jgi:FkbM family methyltransferase
MVFATRESLNPYYHLVFALEPNKYVYPVLERNSQLNLDKTNITPFMFAATPEDCKMTFEYSDSGFCNGGYHEGISKWQHGHAFNLEVEGKNLETFLRTNFPDSISKIKYIKIDAEGYDLSIIKSLIELIKECKPYLSVEVFKKLNKEQRKELFNTLSSLGYLFYKIESETNFKGIEINELNFYDWKHFDMFCVPK